MDLATVDDATARPLLMALCAVLRDVYGDSAHDVLVAEAGRRVGLHDPSTDGGTVGGMSNNDKPGHPDCHECGGTGTNASGLPCFACHHGANLAARRQPSPYSAAAVEATVDHLRARIRELEADLSTAQGERDDLRDAARAVVRSEGEPVFARHTAWRRLAGLVKP